MLRMHSRLNGLVTMKYEQKFMVAHGIYQVQRMQELAASEERVLQESKRNEGLQIMADNASAELDKACEEIHALTSQNELLRKDADGLKKSLGRANSLFSWFGKASKTKVIHYNCCPNKIPSVTTHHGQKLSVHFFM